MKSDGLAPRDSIREQRTALVVMAAVVLLAGANWVLSPEQALRWLRAMLLLPLVWLAVMLWHRWTRQAVGPRGVDDESAMTRYFHAALSLAILAIGIRLVVSFGLEIWVRLGNPSADHGTERSILGLATSAVFVVIGNRLPKILTPLSMLPPEPAQRVTTARRFVGRSFVLIGLLLALVFVSAPLAYAVTLERWSIVLGLMLMLGAVVWMNTVRSASERR